MAKPSPAAALRAYDERFLDCRDLRHTWVQLGFYRREGDRRLFREMSCERCGTLRTDVWDARGNRLANRYRYPEGFRLPRTTGDGITPARVRREVLARAEVYGSREELAKSLPPRRRRAMSG